MKAPVLDENLVRGKIWPAITPTIQPMTAATITLDLSTVSSSPPETESGREPPRATRPALGNGGLGLLLDAVVDQPANRTEDGRGDDPNNQANECPHHQTDQAADH